MLNIIMCYDLVSFYWKCENHNCKLLLNNRIFIESAAEILVNPSPSWRTTWVASNPRGQHPYDGRREITPSSQLVINGRVRSTWGGEFNPLISVNVTRSRLKLAQCIPTKAELTKNMCAWEVACFLFCTLFSWMNKQLTSHIKNFYWTGGIIVQPDGTLLETYTLLVFMYVSMYVRNTHITPTVMKATTS